MLIHESTKNMMDELAQRFFWMNKKLDRMKAVLNTKFAMPNLAKLIHLELAHSYPLLADDVNDIEEMFNYDPNYLEVEAAKEDYEDVDSLLNQLYEWTLETNDKLHELKGHAFNAGDFNVYDMLIPLSIKYSKYVSNAILLVDKKALYGNNLHAMDDNVDEWWVL